MPKQDDKYFTRCSLYKTTAETSNFNNYKSQFKKLNIFTSSCSFGSLRACLVHGWAGLQHPSGQTHQRQGHSMIRSRIPVSMGSALVCFVFYEAASWVRVWKGCHNGEGTQEQLQKVSLYSTTINSKPTLSQDAGEQRILYGTR